MSEEGVIVEEKAVTPIWQWVLMAILLLVILGLVAFNFLYLPARQIAPNNNDSNNFPTADVDEEQPQFAEPLGTLFMTFVDIESNTPSIYTLDVSTESSGFNQFVSELSPAAYMHFLYPADGNHYVVHTISDESVLTNNEPGIHYFDAEIGVVDWVEAAASETVQDNFSTHVPSNRLAYSYNQAVDEALELAPVSLLRRQIDIVNAATPEEESVSRTIPQADEPHFSPDGERLFFLEEQGPSVLDFESNEILPLFQNQDNVLFDRYGSLTVSYDGSMLAFTNPAIGFIGNFRLSPDEESATGIVLEELFIGTDVLDTRYGDIVFSLDNNHIAAMAQTEDEEGKLTDLIVIIDAASGWEVARYELPEGQSYQNTSLDSWFFGNVTE